MVGEADTIETGFVPGKGWVGWDRWFYPLDFPLKFEIEESDGSVITFDAAEGVDWYTTNQDHSNQNAPLPGKSLYRAFQNYLNNNSSNNVYGIRKSAISHANAPDPGIEIYLESGSTDFQINFTDVPSMLALGFPNVQGNTTPAQTQVSDVAPIGSAWLPAFQLADKRPWRERRGRSSGGGVQAGRIREGGFQRRFPVRYEFLGSADVWPDRFGDQNEGPFFDAPNSTLVEHAHYYSEAPPFDLSAINAWMLYQYGLLSKELFMVNTEQGYAGELKISGYNRFLGVGDFQPRFMGNHLEEVERQERYHFQFDFLVREFGTL